MNTCQAIEKAADILGSQAALARQLSVTPAMVNQWVKGIRPIAAERCPAIEKATAGAVTCEELRPDVDWAVLRNSPIEKILTTTRAQLGLEQEGA